MFLYLGIVLVLISSGHSKSIDNNLVDSSYESNEFVEEDINRHSKNESRMIFPGTKWCGPGNAAGGYDDLGHFEETDKCCRAHDHCDGIEAGGTKYGLINDTPYTKLHCGCDKAFYQCLRKIDEVQSDMIGELYFVANKKCYKKAYPIVECESYIYYLWMRRCTRYKVDSSKPAEYQFFDLPFYDTVENKLEKQRSSCNKRNVIPMNMEVSL